MLYCYMCPQKLLKYDVFTSLWDINKREFEEIHTLNDFIVVISIQWFTFPEIYMHIYHLNSIRETGHEWGTIIYFCGLTFLTD